MKKRERLDNLLVERGLAASRSQAKALILAGKVRSGTEVLTKAGQEVARSTELTVTESARFVSRGGEKLEGYFARYPWPIAGRRILDVGASTGGFTDYLLKQGAAAAVCLDVGHGQLHYQLRNDPRVTNIERINARLLKPGQLPHPDYPLIVMDLSFISLRLILPVVWPLLQPGGLLVALIKPQFEVGKAVADRCRGVITDPRLREQVRDEILQFAVATLPGCVAHGCTASPITGVNGNLEYLAGWTKDTAIRVL